MDFLKRMIKKKIVVSSYILAMFILTFMVGVQYLGGKLFASLPIEELGAVTYLLRLFFDYYFALAAGFIFGAITILKDDWFEGIGFKHVVNIVVAILIPIAGVAFFVFTINRLNTRINTPNNEPVANFEESPSDGEIFIHSIRSSEENEVVFKSDEGAKNFEEETKTNLDIRLGLVDKNDTNILAFSPEAESILTDAGEQLASQSTWHHFKSVDNFSRIDGWLKLDLRGVKEMKKPADRLKELQGTVLLKTANSCTMVSRSVPEKIRASRETIPELSRWEVKDAWVPGEFKLQLPAEMKESVREVKFYDASGKQLSSGGRGMESDSIVAELEFDYRADFEELDRVEINFCAPIEKKKMSFEFTDIPLP